MAKSIHEEFIRTLKHVEWMDARTRAAAIEKASAMNFHIAYADELVDNDKLEEYYHGLELQSDSLLHSALHIRKFNKRFETSQLRKPVNKTDWRSRSTRTTKVDAFYSPPENSISMSFNAFCFDSLFDIYFSFHSIASWNTSRSFFLGCSVCIPNEYPRTESLNKSN